jgi:rhodanese-related sulfurtransferase
MLPGMDAVTFFAARLRWQTDPSDLAAERAGGSGPVVIDTRDDAAWRQGRIPGALHVPGAELAGRIDSLVADPSERIVVYCWGPGCNGSTKAALRLAELGYENVRELVGGFEYWAREGLAIETDAGRRRLAADPLTAPVSEHAHA